jgi:hypothetical protein
MTAPYTEHEGGLDHSGHTVVSDSEPGREPEVTVYEDYWGTKGEKLHYMPDGKQYFKIKKMNEGDRAKYQFESGMQMTSMRKTGDTKIDINQAKDREALVCAAVIDWSLFKDQSPVPFNKGSLRAWIQGADPKLLDKLLMDIRKFNPFLQEDLSVKEIDEQMQELRELRDVAAKREAEADFSPAK